MMVLLPVWSLLLTVASVLSSVIPLTPDDHDHPQDGAGGPVDNNLVAPVVGDVFSTYYLHLEEKGRTVMEEVREEGEMVRQGQAAQAEIRDLGSDPLFLQFLETRKLSLDHLHLQHPETRNYSSEPSFLQHLETRNYSSEPLFLQYLESRNLSLNPISLKYEDTVQLGSDPLYLQYGVVTERLGQTLEVAERLPFQVLLHTPHGRHLLLISLLEHVESPAWEARCFGRLQLFLPPSLRPQDQPSELPEGAILLGGLLEGEREVTRQEVEERVHALVPAALLMTDPPSDMAMFSLFNPVHRASLGALVDWALGLDFSPSLSLLVTLQGLVTSDLFLELVTLTILGRQDCGLVLPYRETVTPRLFYTGLGVVQPSGGRQMEEQAGVEEPTGNYQHAEKEPGLEEPVGHHLHSDELGTHLEEPGLHLEEPASAHYGRFRRSHSWWHWETGPTEVDWTGSRGQRGPWYFREDPRMNSHHAHWHLVSGGTHRRREVFYYMHNQMLNRYKAEILSRGESLPLPLGPEVWRTPIREGYDGGIAGFVARVPGRRMGGAQMATHNRIMGQIDRGQYGGYRDGVDQGIEALAGQVEDGIHGWGHMTLAAMTGARRGQSVMASSSVSARDPFFYRWHGYVENIFQRYKATLGPYSWEDLSFPGLEVVAARLVTQGGRDNTLHTSRVRDQVDMAGIQNNGGDSIRMSYIRLDHEEFSLEVTLQAETRSQAVVRAFLVSTEQESVVLELDQWLASVGPGQTRESRREGQAPHLSRRPGQSLQALQRSLLQGQVSRRMFNWAGCGWPLHLNIPSGRPEGMAWRLVVVASPVLARDRARVRDWQRADRVAWSYCGVQEGRVPDSRPLGFPLDRPASRSSLDNLASSFPNILLQEVTIVIRGGHV